MDYGPICGLVLRRSTSPPPKLESINDTINRLRVNYSIINVTNKHSCTAERCKFCTCVSAINIISYRKCSKTDYSLLTNSANVAEVNCARNYASLLNSVKVTPKILAVPFFPRHGIVCCTHPKQTWPNIVIKLDYWVTTINRLNLVINWLIFTIN